MTVDWSDHAKEQLASILGTIARELSREDASRWNMKIYDAVRNLPDFPDLGGEIPKACFATIPLHGERLRQTLCGPYRIIYETVGRQIRVLAIMHSRMLISSGDASGR